MRSNSKHSIEELGRSIKMYLDEGLSYHELSNVYGLLIDASTFNARVLKYQEHGIVGIQMKRRNNHYSKQFKKYLVNEHIENGVPIRELACRYNIPTHGTIRTWIIKYTRGEEMKTYSPKPEVYTMKSRNVTHDEKVEIVKDCLANELSYKEI